MSDVMVMVWDVEWRHHSDVMQPANRHFLSLCLLVCQVGFCWTFIELAASCQHSQLQHACKLRHTDLSETLQFTQSPWDLSFDVREICRTLPDLGKIYTCLKAFMHRHNCVIETHANSHATAVSPELLVFMSNITEKTCIPACLDLNVKLAEAKSCLRISGLAPKDRGTIFSPPQPACSKVTESRVCLNDISIPQCAFLKQLLNDMLMTVMPHFHTCGQKIKLPGLDQHDAYTYDNNDAWRDKGGLWLHVAVLHIGILITNIQRRL